MGANNRVPCRPSRRVKWCVVSNLEENKCRWLREASIVYGVEPAISCIQELTRADCLKALKTERADIFIAKPEELFQARKWVKMRIVFMKKIIFYEKKTITMFKIMLAMLIMFKIGLV